MAKIFRMRRPSSSEVLVRAERLEARAFDPSERDDPAWLLRCAEAMRQFAARRTAAHVRRVEERRKHPKVSPSAGLFS
jgi:hypothetical protein